MVPPPKINGASSTKKRMRTVQSGIGISSLDKSAGSAASSIEQNFLTSRTARVLLAGAGFLADAYDLFVINLVLRLLKDEYPEYTASGNIHQLQGTVASAALFGAIVGQLVAGSLADIVGRKVIFVATAALITIGSIGSACSFESSYMTVYGHIACWRFLLGAGVGGEYPLAATVTSESSSAASRGRLMAAVFAMQGVGALFSVLVVIACLSSGFSTAFSWRFSLAFGALPAIIAFPWRLRMHETETFERVKQGRADAAERRTAELASDLHSNSHSHSGTSQYGSTDKEAGSTSGSGSVPAASAALKVTGSSRMEELKHTYYFYKYHMLGTASCWFLLDVVFYANGLFNHDVTSLVLSNGQPTTALQDAFNSAFICIVAVPGYWLSVQYLERVGRKDVQLMGFCMMGLLFFVCGVFRDWFLQEGAPFSRKVLFLVLYSLTFLFSNFGPNTTTFVIPGEIYPPEVRATCHGVSAACGKLGAATGAFFFPLVLGPAGSTHPTNAGLRTSMFLCSGIAFLGAVVTHFFTPRYGASELESEDNYLMLEHACLVPSDEDLAWLETHKESRRQGMMFEVVEAVYDDYNEESFAGDDTDDVGCVMDADGGLVTGGGGGEGGGSIKGTGKGWGDANGSIAMIGVGAGTGAGAGGYQSVPNHSIR